MNSRFARLSSTLPRISSAGDHMSGSSEFIFHLLPDLAILGSENKNSLLTIDGEEQEQQLTKREGERNVLCREISTSNG